MHPLAWWAWALILAALAIRSSTLPVLLALAAAAAIVVHHRAPPQGRATFTVFLRLGVVIVAIRLGLTIAFAPGFTGQVLADLPMLTLPLGDAALRIGGDLHLPAVLSALTDGVRIATIVVCVGAANALCEPTRLLRTAPAALYEAGVAVIVGLTFTPALAGDLGRVHAAQRLRGRPTRGIAAFGRTLVAALDGAMDRAIGLAGAMAARGYGRRTSAAHPAPHRAQTAALLTALIALALGAYGMTDVHVPASVSIGLIAGGAVLAGAVLGWAGRAQQRTRYRADPWRAPEWLVLGCALTASLLLLPVVGPTDDIATRLPWPIAGWLVLACAGLSAALPAWLTPAPPVAS